MHNIECVDAFDFADQFSTYWGRRRLGMVIDNEIANRMRSDGVGMTTIYSIWRADLTAYPVQVNLRLMGTPALDVEVVRQWDAATERPAPPPPALVGRYAGEPGVRAEVGDEPIVIVNSGLKPSPYRALMNSRFAGVVALVAVGANEIGLPALAVTAGVSAVFLAVTGEVAGFKLKAKFLGFRVVNWITVPVALAVVVFALIDLIGTQRSVGISL